MQNWKWLFLLVFKLLKKHCAQTHVNLAPRGKSVVNLFDISIEELNNSLENAKASYCISLANSSP